MTFGCPLMPTDEWRFLISEMQTEELAPSMPSPFWEDGWQPQLFGKTFAVAQVTRRDGSDVGDLQGRHFRIGQQELRILRVLEQEGNCAVVRCQVRHVSELHA